MDTLTDVQPYVDAAITAIRAKAAEQVRTLELECLRAVRSIDRQIATLERRARHHIPGCACGDG